jgi:hypothetical protein
MRFQFASAADSAAGLELGVSLMRWQSSAAHRIFLCRGESASSYAQQLHD